jgi:hypothetical protein
VTDASPLLVVENAIVSNTVEHVRIEQLPVNGRMLNTFQTLLPGAEGTGGTAGFRLFGQPAQAEEWIVDGAVMTDRRWNMSLFSQAPGVGAVHEFTVLADAVTAKYTRPVNVIVSTKSGTDQFHGTAYETIRNSSIGGWSPADNFTKRLVRAIRLQRGRPPGNSQGLQRPQAGLLVLQLRGAPSGREVDH